MLEGAHFNKNAGASIVLPISATELFGSSATIVATMGTLLSRPRFDSNLEGYLAHEKQSLRERTLCVSLFKNIHLENELYAF